MEVSESNHRIVLGPCRNPPVAWRLFDAVVNPKDHILLNFGRTIGISNRYPTVLHHSIRALIRRPCYISEHVCPFHCRLYSYSFQFLCESSQEKLRTTNDPPKRLLFFPVMVYYAESWLQVKYSAVSLFVIMLIRISITAGGYVWRQSRPSW